MKQDCLYAAAYAAYAAAAADAAAAFAARVHHVNPAWAAQLAVWATSLMRSAIRRDFVLLAAVTEHEKWTDDTPVPPEFFGPLWPDGVPEGWPMEETDRKVEPHALKIQFSVPQGMSKQHSREFNEKVVAFFTALSALDASMGGTGLQILEDESEDPIDIEEEEPTYTGANCAGVGA